MKTYLKLAWRNIWRNKRRTLITISAIVFAVMASVFMQSLNRGSHEQIIENMTRFHTGYLQIQDYRYYDEPSLDNSFYFDDSLQKRVFETDENISFILPRIETFMLAANGQSSRGSLVLAVDLDKEDRFNNLKSRITKGRFFKADEQAAVLSEGFANRLNLDVDDTLVLIGQGRFGMSASGLFRISGIMHHPLPDMNLQTVYLPMTSAQELLSAEGYITSLLIAPERERQLESVASSLRSEFEDEELLVYTWQELIPELLELLEFDLVGAYIISYILYIVIAFGFFGTILTMTMERIKEFGILISVGMGRLRLAFTLFLEVLAISILGVLSGTVAAFLLIYYFHINPITVTGDMAEMVIEMGWDPVIPVSFAADQFYTQGIIVFIIAMVISLYPIIKVFNLNVIKASRI